MRFRGLQCLLVRPRLREDIDPARSLVVIARYHAESYLLHQLVKTGFHICFHAVDKSGRIAKWVIAVTEYGKHFSRPQ